MKENEKSSALSTLRTDDNDNEQTKNGGGPPIRGGSQSSSSSMSIPLPPDGGWGWVVCFATFLCMTIMDGILFSFGVFFLQLLEYFKESKGKTAWVGSTLMGMHMLLGKPLTVSSYPKLLH